jgi:peptidyl-prolyl cis-trans isomerase-like 4
MSVLLDLSCGELVIDLFVDECPLACENFLKLCKHKFYHNCLLWNVQSNYIVQTGDPTGTGKGGKSAKRLLGISQQETFPDEVTASRLINRTGLVCMANSGAPDTNRSQFFITLSDEHLTHLDGKHTIFGEIAEGFDVLAKINALFCDGDGRPFQDVRILHTHVLDDPFPDPNGLVEPPSPDRKRPETEEVSARIPYEEDLDEGNDVQTQIELEESIKRKAAQSRAIVLEMTGDIPDADIKPPAEGCYYFTLMSYYKYCIILRI